MLLAPKADADSRKWTVEIAVVGFAGLDTTIHRAEEEVGAIAETELGVGIAERSTGKSADIGYNDRVGTGEVYGVRRDDMIGNAYVLTLNGIDVGT